MQDSDEEDDLSITKSQDDGSRDGDSNEERSGGEREKVLTLSEGTLLN